MVPGPVRIAYMLGDGIGPAVVGGTLKVLAAVAERRGFELDLAELPVGLTALEAHGSTLPQETIDTLRESPGSMLGPLSTAGYDVDDPRTPNPSGVLRKALGLYANVRPARSRPGIESRWSGVDLVIVRENTEGFYADRNMAEGRGEFRLDADRVISLRVITRDACLRVAEHAFAIASRREGPGKVTAVHKANVLRYGDGLFLRSCAEVARRFPGIEFADRHVDAFAMDLVLDPTATDVVVTTNMFGDILSDEAAGLIGGLGLAPGLNHGDQHVMAQAVHGSAPELAEQSLGNPIAAILSGAMLLDSLGMRLKRPDLLVAAREVEGAVDRTLAAGVERTPDIGGTGRTDDVVAAVLAELSGSAA